LDSAREHESFLKRHGRPTSLYNSIKYSSHQEFTKGSFGYQWTKFPDMVKEFREDFLKFIYPVRPSFLKGKLILDAGCGFGRHLYYAASFGATAIGMDLSKAVDEAWKNTRTQPRAYIVQGDIYNPPFREEIFDYVYSLGVLHHLPVPEEGLHALLSLLKPQGTLSIWVYSKSRKVANALLEMVRFLARRLPYPLMNALSFMMASLDWGIFIFPYKVLRKYGLMERFAFPRVMLYARYPFVVCWTDWFDRLSAPIRFYYDKKDLQGWARRARLKNVHISPTGLYGWRLRGRKRKGS